jgi:hypothetical protein
MEYQSFNWEDAGALVGDGWSKRYKAALPARCSRWWLSFAGH